MTEKFILAIDQGTTGSTALLVDEKLEVRAKANQEFPQVFPKPGWVEHQADEIWRSIEGAVNRCLGDAGVSASSIAGIGITNQRETTCLFDADSKPLHNFIVWQCRRTADRCQKLKDAGHEDLFRKKTGLVLDPYFSGTKMQWLLDEVEGAREKAEQGEAKFGTIDTWMVHKLTGGAAYITDVTNASRTLMMDLESLDWDEELMGILGVPRAALPDIKSSSEIYGETKGVGFLPDGIPVAGIAGDQQAALFGQACFEKGEAKCTYGTGCFLLLNTGEEIVHSSNGLLTTVASQVNGKTQYALEGAAFIGGAAVQWLRDGLGFIETAPQIEEIASQAPDTGDVVFVPALAGLGAPHWRPEARGLLAGFSRDTTKAHICRAVLEGIALQNRDILDAMVKDAGEMKSLKVDGGASANNLLMQMQADFLDAMCIRPKVVETTGLGAAALAGLAVGLFSDQDEVRKVWRRDTTFEPKMSAEDRDAVLAKWNRAVERA